MPVKNGWQAEQISTWMVGTVDRVSMVLPQAQTMAAFWYCGWMPSFMRRRTITPGAGRRNAKRPPTVDRRGGAIAPAAPAADNGTVRGLWELMESPVSDVPSLRRRTNMLVAFAQLADELEGARAHGNGAGGNGATATRRLLEA